MHTHFTTGNPRRRERRVPATGPQRAQRPGRPAAGTDLGAKRSRDWREARVRRIWAAGGRGASGEILAHCVGDDGAKVRGLGRPCVPGPPGDLHKLCVSARSDASDPGCLCTSAQHTHSFACGHSLLHLARHPPRRQSGSGIGAASACPGHMARRPRRH